MLRLTLALWSNNVATRLSPMLLCRTAPWFLWKWTEMTSPAEVHWFAFTPAQKVHAGDCFGLVQTKQGRCECALSHLKSHLAFDVSLRTFTTTINRHKLHENCNFRYWGSCHDLVIAVQLHQETNFLTDRSEQQQRGGDFRWNTA